MTYLKTPMLVEFTQSIDERESTEKALFNNVPYSAHNIELVQHGFIEMVALLAVAQSENDFIGENECEVLSEFITSTGGHLNFSSRMNQQGIGYSVNLMNLTDEKEAAALQKVEHLISDIITFYDTEKVLLEVFKLIKRNINNQEIMHSIQTGSFYSKNKPFKCFFDLAIKSDDWNALKIAELFEACH